MRYKKSQIAKGNYFLINWRDLETYVVKFFKNRRSDFWFFKNWSSDFQFFTVKFLLFISCGRSDFSLFAIILIICNCSLDFNGVRYGTFKILISDIFRINTLVKFCFRLNYYLLLILISEMVFSHKNT